MLAGDQHRDQIHVVTEPFPPTGTGWALLPFPFVGHAWAPTLPFCGR
jgi:hypothetical protein